jgi:nitrite reductase/ring-hydroxylating ferredoxin subunit
MKHPLCSIADIPATGTKVIAFFGRDVHVLREGGEPRAVANTCLHLGGPLEFKEGRFVCPWHGAEFAADGRCRKGPAPTNARLMTLPTRIENGVLTYVWGE